MSETVVTVNEVTQVVEIVDQGPIGPQGTRGSLWFHGEGAPDAIDGELENDCYVDDLTGDSYTLTSDGWELTSNVLGTLVVQAMAAAEAADDSETAAAISESNAASSASTAATQAAAASASAAAADASEAAASTSQSAAASSASAASTSAGNASTSATAAAGSASAAATSATNAGTSATNAAASEAAAAGSASTASTQASNASSSASAAAGSASAAATSATNAGNSATAAGTSETNAAASASAAATSATNAGNSATAAAGSASDASDDADAAAASATAASGSATAAGTSETNAASSASAASSSASAASSSASAAATSASNAATSETNAAASAAAAAADATAAATHIADTSAAHAASAISIADAGNDFTATDVEGALAELVTAIEGAAGSPGGSDTQIQFNDATAFGGDADFTWNKTTNVLTVNGSAALTGVSGAAPLGAFPTLLVSRDINSETNLSIENVNATGIASIRMGVAGSGTTRLIDRLFASSGSPIMEHQLGTSVLKRRWTSGSTVLMCQHANGNLNIGTSETDPSVKLKVEGALTITPGAGQFAVNAAGNVTIAAPTSGTALTVAGEVASNQTVAGDASFYVRNLSANAAATMQLVFGNDADDGAVIKRTSDGSASAGALDISCADGVTINGLRVGYHNVPKSATTSGTLTAAEHGKCVPATGGVTINPSVFAAGDCVSIYNDSGSAITITQGASMTLRLVGTATTGNRTLAQRGMATIWFSAHNDAVISGGGLT